MKRSQTIFYRISQVVICFLALAQTSLQARSSPMLTQAEVLSRYRQANAGLADSVHTLRVNGTETTGGARGTFVTLYKEGGKRLVVSQLGLVNETRGSDGKTSWVLDSNGIVRLQSSEEDKDQYTEQAIGSGAFADPEHFQGQVVLRPRTEKHTGDYVLDVVPIGGRATTLFVDPKTFLLMREERLEDDRVATTTYSNYKQWSVGQQATQIRTHSGDKKYDFVQTITNEEINVNAPDDLFAVPVSVKNYTWLASDKISAIVPFDDYDTAIKLYVGINGLPAYVVLDSGSSDFVIAKWATDLLKIKSTGLFEARAYGGSADLRPVQLENFEIPDAISFHGLTATAVDLPPSITSATPSVGFVGYPLLSRFVVQVNYLNEDIIISPPETWVPGPADGISLPLELNDNVPSVLASFDGLPAAHFLIDTGDTRAVSLYTPYVAQNKLADRYPKGMNVIGQGIGGKAETREVRAHQFSIAGTTLQDVPTNIALKDKAGASVILAGAIGYQFLSHFTVTFDYPHRRVFFAPNANTQKPFDTRTFGIFILPVSFIQKSKHAIGLDRHLMVVGLDAKSPVARAGMKAGGELIGVDGQSISDLSIGEIRRMLSAEGGKDMRDLKWIDTQGRMKHATATLYDPLPRADTK